MNTFKYYLPAIAVAAILFFLSSLPGHSVPRMGFQYEDLFLHFLAYSVFGYTLGLAFLHNPPSVSSKRILLAFLIGLIYAISDEYHQSFVPGRSPAVSDVIADCLGSLFGLYCFLTWLRRRGLSKAAD